jgi:tellurite methyltransferase
VPAVLLFRSFPGATMVPMPPSPLQAQFGPIDIYLFDQLLRGRIQPGMTILDAGCGGGRNLVYLLNEGFQVHGADADARSLAPLQARFGSERFRAEPLEAMTFPDDFADVVLASAVLHFARSDAHFAAMLRGCWRLLRPGGLFFCRLASSIGLPPDSLAPLGDNRFHLPDGSDRYLVDEATLLQWTATLGADLLDPLKTTVVQGQRAMTTWVLRKR